MALIEPFRGTTYSPALRSRLARLVTQPYDKIDRTLQATYYARDPLNVIRVVKSNETGSDPESDYPEAARTLAQWLEDGTLLEAETPAIYLYYQTFRYLEQTYVRKGFMASVALEERNVRSHEHTLAGPKADRLRLLRALRTNDELIFMLYSDAEGETVRLMDSVASNRKPLFECQDDYGELHQVWALTDEELVTRLQALLAPCDLFIADGHHRYETALNYKQECLNRGWNPVGAQGFDHRMMGLFPMEDPGLVVLPTHRLVKGVENFSGQKLVAALNAEFAITPLSSADALFAQLDTVGTDQVFGMRAVGTRDNYYFLQAKGSTVMVSRAELSGLSEASRNLGVTILHARILEEELGIDAAKLSAETHVEYVRDRKLAVESVGGNGIQAAFILNPTSVADVKAVASAGERMPQKSTDFYPKLLAGLVMMRLGIEQP